MSIYILGDFIKACKILDIEPTWERLNQKLTITLQKELVDMINSYEKLEEWARASKSIAV